MIAQRLENESRPSTDPREGKHGRRLYFSGDTESPAHLIVLRELDVAFVSPWLYRAVLKAGGRVDARRVVIYHHESTEAVPECRQGCHVPRQGETLRF